MDSPLVSFCVKFCNQVDYVEPALCGAFSQTYRPLEIVISDDGSTDGSHELIQKLVAEYREKGGDVPIAYNHNATNLGNLGNWDKLCSLCKGELLVKADGDDISFPERTAEIVRRWLVDGCKAVVVSHGGVRISPKGQKLGPSWIPNARLPLGAAMAWSRKCYTEFPPCENGRPPDDTVYAWRAVFLGTELVFDTPLVYYRVGSGVSSVLNRPRQPTLRGWRTMVAGDVEALKDLEYLHEKGKIEESRYRVLKAEVENQRDYASSYVRLIEGASFAIRLAAFRELGKSPNGCLTRILQFVYVFPAAFGDLILNAYSTVRFLVKRLASR